ncbi:MAG: alanine racemase [Lachnospiraceae bacterium]|nr:alanine racemase [Lachnospiraceae bacterium]
MKNYLRAYAEINLDAINHNIREVKRSVGEDVKVMAVIKADGYGHGAVMVANSLNEVGIDGFAVAIIEEGIILRKRGIQSPILILGYTSPYQYGELVQYGLTQTVFHYEMAEKISEFAVLLGKKAKIHIKVDTGMNRIGFKDNEESVEIIRKIKGLPNIEIEGIFTHFACADETDKTSAYHQYERYEKFVTRLEKAGISIPVKHVSNSAAIMDLEDVRLDMVRSGIMTYGLYPSEEVDHNKIKLQPALSFKSHIIYIKEVEAGEGVSYGSTYVTTRKTKIATIPVGYADGYPRALSSKGRVLIRGQYAPIIGRICMDQFMVDVTEVEGVEELDDVILVGRDGDHEITVEEVANVNSFNYEFICGLSRRVPRVYYQNGKLIRTIDYLNE